MTKVTIHAAKTHLSQLIERACAGEEVIISRGATPVVKLVPVREPGHADGRRFGAFAGRLPPVPDSFFDALPKDELDAWEQ